MAHDTPLLILTLQSVSCSCLWCSSTLACQSWLFSLLVWLTLVCRGFDTRSMTWLNMTLSFSSLVTPPPPGLLAWIVIVGQRLNGVTSVCLTMSCGFAADCGEGSFIITELSSAIRLLTPPPPDLSHMSHAFLTASGTRVERAVQAIDEMAIPIIGGAVATFLGVLMLAFANNALTR